MANYSTALITGASSGIGYQLAKLFAHDGYNLVLVSRNETRLNEVAAELLQQYGQVHVTVIAKDLSKDGSAQEVYQETQAQGIHVDVLVNDAGFGEHGLFAETDLDKELAMIHLNVLSLTHLTKLYLRDMLAKKQGRILQLASVASYQPTPLLAVYAATKAYVLSFSEALVNELKDTGVSVTALIPGATDTNFFIAAGAENSNAAHGSLSDPAEVAKAGYQALMRGEDKVVVGLKNQVMTAASNVLPDQANAAMARKQMEEK
jgi:uncharacterized protein